ncbi:hypothetical protein D7V80_30705 [Corallococcus sp. CA054B]|nr:hypothetical protein D7V80_30705 [Corallococcus sp. CA054B]
MSARLPPLEPGKSQDASLSAPPGTAPLRLEAAGAQNLLDSRTGSESLRLAPRSLDALQEHDCIRYRFVSTGRVESWALRQPASAPAPRIPETFVFNNSEAVTHAARAGFGIAQFVELMIRPELEAGTLRPFLREHSLERGALWLVLPQTRRTPPKVKALGDFLARLVEEDEAGAR